jgi:hypothetical protein
MLQLHKYKGGTFRRYAVSAQTHCDALEVEKWIQDAADKKGAIHNISVEIHGTKIPLSHVSEAYVVAALFAADHNEYVTRNLGYAPELTSESESTHNSDTENDSACGAEDDMHHLIMDQELHEDFEQNEDCVVGDFGPSHAEHSNW